MSKEIEINCQNYTNFLRIGHGSYGTVYRANDKRNGLYVSIKEFIKDRFKTQKEIFTFIRTKRKNKFKCNYF